MREFEIGGVRHRTRDLSAYEQFHLLHAIIPIFPAVTFLTELRQGDVKSVVDRLKDIDDSKISVGFRAAVGACERLVDDVWVVATAAMPLHDIVMLILHVSDENFAAYLSMAKPEFVDSFGKGAKYLPVEMPDGESWLFRPCMSAPQLIPLAAIYDGSLKIEHVLKANHLLEVQGENAARAQKAAERDRG